MDTDRLNSEDAVLVVALHTDGGILGYLTAIGNIDFFPNGGIPVQPGCLQLEDCKYMLAASISPVSAIPFLYLYLHI